jgi:hypothetical protein
LSTTFLPHYFVFSAKRQSCERSTKMPIIAKQPNRHTLNLAARFDYLERGAKIRTGGGVKRHPIFDSMPTPFFALTCA